MYKLKINLKHFNFRMNPINVFLSGIAVADMLVMMEYVPFTLHMYILNTRDREERVRQY